jgi:hypothetical protein
MEITMGSMGSQGRQVFPGERGRPRIVTPESNPLSFAVTSVRTRALHIGGQSRTVVDFKVSYD